jgi:hypothetical protein
MTMSKIKIYLDDVRTPTEPGWIIVRSHEQLLETLGTIGLENISLISLDHDLGDTAVSEWYNNVKPNYQLNYSNIMESTGMDSAKWLVDQWLAGAPPVLVVVHSANPIGAGNIMGYINNYRKNHGLPENCIRVRIPHTITH